MTRLAPLLPPPAAAARVAAALGAVTVVGAVSFLVAHGAARGADAFLRALAAQALTYAAWVPIAAGVAWVARAVARRRPAARWGWGAVWLAWPVATLVHGAAAGIATWVARSAAPGAAEAGAPGADSALGVLVRAHVTGGLPVEILQYWALVGALAAVEARRRLADRERAAARLEAELSRARLAALQARVQPHFLYNTLQSIALLVPRDPAAAQRMTVHLGDLLRASFDRGAGAHADAEFGPPDVALGEELALARAYVAIEAERFRDRLRVRWETDAAPADARVPELVLQPLVENALRHGLWPRPGGGTLAVRARADGGRLVLQVEDDGTGLPNGWTDGAGEGVGLGATRARLAAAYGGEASLVVAPAPGGGTRATVVLPLERPAGAGPAAAGRREAA